MGYQMPHYMRNNSNTGSSKHLQNEMDMYNLHWKQRYEEQSIFIARLMDKMKKEFNIDPSQLDPIFLDMSQQNDYQEMEMNDEYQNKKLMDFIITFGKDEKQMNLSQVHFESFDHLKDTLRKEFQIEEEF